MAHQETEYCKALAASDKKVVHVIKKILLWLSVARLENLANNT